MLLPEQGCLAFAVVGLERRFPRRMELLDLGREVPKALVEGGMHSMQRLVHHNLLGHLCWPYRWYTPAHPCEPVNVSAAAESPTRKGPERAGRADFGTSERPWRTPSGLDHPA